MTTKICALLIFLTLSIYYPLMAQKQFNYDASWKKVEEQLSKGLPKSAMEEVNKIYTQAKRENREAQQVKALIYKSQLVQQVEENNWYKNVQSFEKETAAAREPAKQILHSISADLYYNYFQTQRWKIYERSATINFVKDDPETWTKEDFHKIIAAHYQASLSNSALLQQTKLDAYDPIITKGNQRKLRPTLYDLLAHKALDYYKTGEIEITKPAYEFQLNDEANLAVAKIFIRYDYKSKDSSSNQLATIKLYQDLVRFHVNDNDKAALVDVDIERVLYGHENSVNEGKEQQYKEALEHIYSQYNSIPEAMQAGYVLAQWWWEKGETYEPLTGTEVDKNALKQAATLAAEVAKKFPSSEGSINAANLLKGLVSPLLSMEVEKVNTINEAFRSLVKFKNTSGMFLRLIKADDAVEKQISDDANYQRDTYWKKLAQLKAVRNWQQPLPVFDDLREHSAEIKIDALPAGRYILFASKNNDFSTGENALAATELNVSNISFVNSNNDYFFLHRQTGKPLDGALIQLWNTSYDYNTRKRISTKGALVKADKNGYLQLPDTKSANNYNANTRLEISYKTDRLFMKDEISSTRDYNNETKNEIKPDWDIARYFIFIDRSIYRPGQLVYFKAIGVVPHAAGANSQRGNSLFLPGKPITVELINANGEVADTMQLTPNEYGSINGSFKLPESGLTGNFTLHVKMPTYSATSFNVEEYKRPKFYVEFEKIKSSYKLNDSINVTGIAKAYAGNNIDGATVKYRVHRITRYLYPWLFWRSGKTIWPPYDQSAGMEITNGETTTDADGKFLINFKAIPDLSTNKALDPSFDYTIDVDVTDLNGETRSGNNTVSVGYKSLVANITIPGGNQQMLDSLKSINITTTNLGGETVPSTVYVKIYKLETPARLIRERYWEQPDTTVMNYAEYVKNFPHDDYKNESDYHSWQKGKLVQSDTFTTSSNPTFALDKKAFDAGWYTIEVITKDKDGNEVKAVEWFGLNDSKKNQPAATRYNITQTLKGTVEPGEQAVFMQGSSASDLFIVQQTIHSELSTGNSEKHSNSGFDFQTPNTLFTIHNFPAIEADRGGYAVNRFFIKDNRVYIVNWIVDVPWTNKALKISFETFRDKLLPGQEEKWKVKISGYKGDAVAAEMLASMYDASLDQFSPHAWQGLDLWNRNSFNIWNGRYNFTAAQNTDEVWQTGDIKSFDKRYDELMTVNRYGRLEGRGGGIAMRSYGNMKIMDAEMAAPQMSMAVTDSAAENVKFNLPKIVKDEEVIKDDKPKEGATNQPDNSTVQIRKNFNETAFFFPDLHTNDKGEIEFSFTIPEALTQWKLQTLAHTKDLSTAIATKSIVTQKRLMVQPNAPRFFRQGDSLVLVSKIVNLSGDSLKGTAQLQLLNAATLEPVDAAFQNKTALQNFSVPAGQSISVSFPISIPMQYTDALMFRIIAKAGDVSDGEEMALPVLTNRMLVTESFPINMRVINSKNFTWDKLLKSGSSASLQNQSLTVEYTSNPAWYAVQALPYLMEYPYDCAEQSWNRFYANALASKIAGSMPKIKAVFEQWKNIDTSALLSNLQKNPELKAVLLEETPWVLDAKNESEQKKNIALLFDMVRMSNETDKAISKLKEMQSSNGVFVWFKGGPDDRYMTQYILTGIGHLQKLNAWPAAQTNTLNGIVAKAIPYLDARLKEDYDNLIKYKADLKKNNLSSIAVQYLYMRSFFSAPITETTQIAYKFYSTQAKQFWLTQSKYDQGMIALALHRTKDAVTPKAILKSLTENSIVNEEFGMYWKEFNTGGYYWWQAPIESHALLIEAYSEIENNSAKVDDLKTWLLKQKQTQNWRSTKATAEACYALLLQGTSWLNAEQSVTIKLGDANISSDKTEAGTGYFKQTIIGEKVTPAMGNISVKLTPVVASEIPPSGGGGASWGSLYWQYFEDLDKIKTAATPMSLKKQLFIQRNSDRGPVITPVNDNDVLKVGDRGKVRIELRTDRNLEYVHLKDMRASCFEPVNVWSQYKYQDGLGYYEATKDASTNFFISYLNKGTYVFEYDLLVTHTGNFSNGISSIQCMYAPEFTSHSEGIRVKVK
ncbi:alpha-2-macroglobulin family protein [soil metagenome]